MSARATRDPIADLALFAAGSWAGLLMVAVSHRPDMVTAGRYMEAFEQFVALAMESEGFVVSSALKFNVRRRTRKQAYVEYQTHGFEVDLIGARRDKLVLATVKSFFGSRGVVADHVLGKDSTYSKWYALLNQPDVREGVVRGAADRFGYCLDEIELRLYAGRFSTAASESTIRAWAAEQFVGSGPVQVYDARSVVTTVRKAAASKQYRDSAVLATLKVLDATGSLQPIPPAA